MILTSDVALLDGVIHEQLALRVVDGAIVDVKPRADLAPAADEMVLDLGRRAMLPGTVNAHNHSFQSLLRGFGDDLPFLQWRERALYRFAPRILSHRPKQDIREWGVYTGA